MASNAAFMKPVSCSRIPFLVTAPLPASRHEPRRERRRCDPIELDRAAAGEQQQDVAVARRAGGEGRVRRYPKNDALTADAATPTRSIVPVPKSRMAPSAPCETLRLPIPAPI